MEGLKGLKGLTPEDRQNWEKSYSSQLEGLTPDQTDRMYKNFKFKEKFGDRPDYNTLKSYTPEQRDSLYNGELMKNNRRLIVLAKPFNKVRTIKLKLIS